MTVIDLVPGGGAHRPATVAELPTADTAPSELTPVPSPAWHAALWFLLVLVSAVLRSDSSLPVAGPHTHLAAALSALAGAVGLMLFQLGTVRFSVFGRPIDLFVGLGFGTLALVNVLIRISQAINPRDVQPLESNLYLLLFAQSIAAGFFLVGLVGADRVVVPQRQRSRFASGLVGAAGWSVAVGVALVIWFAPTLPSAVDPAARALLREGVVVQDALPGQAPWLQVVNAALAGVLLLAPLGYMRLSWRLRDPHVGALAVALALFFFSQVQALLFPPVAVDYISTGDVFRLAAYVTLLLSLVARIGGEIAERAAREERLRLSRELHDGLAQQLSLLNLRLARAAAPGRPAERRASDLEAARRVVDAALLEARQAISALRVGSLPWDEFLRNVRTLADEFAQNHDVAIDVRAEAEGPRRVDAALQVEVLRMLHEAFSNAVRHGQATAVEVAIGGTATSLELRVSDDGVGANDPATIVAGQGVGLRSMAERISLRSGTLRLETNPGRGITLRASLPL